jgi:hypothetical protein
MLFWSVGLNVPLVTSPTGCPSFTTGEPCRAIRRPSSSSPTSLRFGPDSATCRSVGAPMNSFVKSTAQPRPAEIGSVWSVSSWPYSGMPASSRSVSRAPRPAGLMVASARSIFPPSSFIAILAALAGMISSMPSSPV